MIEKVFQNPTWVLRTNHVRDFLQHIVDFGSTWWGLEHIAIPQTVSRGDSGGHSVKKLTRRVRSYQIERGFGEQGFAVAPQSLPVPGLDTGERRLFAAVVRRGLMDFCQNYLSPFGKDQRLALNSYWWIAGLPLLVTHEGFREGPKVLRSFRMARCRLSSEEDPYQRVFQLTPELVVDLGVGKGLPYLPWDLPGPNRHFEELSFESCCEALDLDPVQLRYRMFLIPPDWTGFPDDC